MYKKTFEDVQALGGDAMIDFQVRPKNTFYVISPFGVFFSDCWEATGIAIKMGTGNSFDEKPSQWDKTPDSENFEKKKVVPSKWDAAPKKTH